MFSDCELSVLVDNSMSLSKSLKYFFDVSTVLHRNNSELIFLINPHKECLLGVMENSSRFRPVTLASARFQESISFLEEEVVFLELLLLLWGELSKSIISTLQLIGEAIEGNICKSLNFLSLFS